MSILYIRWERVWFEWVWRQGLTTCSRWYNEWYISNHCPISVYVFIPLLRPKCNDIYHLLYSEKFSIHSTISLVLVNVSACVLYLMIFLAAYWSKHDNDRYQSIKNCHCLIITQILKQVNGRLPMFCLWFSWWHDSLPRLNNIMYIIVDFWPVIIKMLPWAWYVVTHWVNLWSLFILSLFSRVIKILLIMTI